MRFYFTFLSFIFFTTLRSTAQNPLNVIDTMYGSVKVRKDPRFDVLAAKQAEINLTAQKYIVKRVQGWRIQAANTQNREEANAVKTLLLQQFPEDKTYLIYQAPSFRVRIGNFENQKDAFPLRKKITALFPGKGIYIIPDIIEIAPPADAQEEQN